VALSAPQQGDEGVARDAADFSAGRQEERSSQEKGMGLA
jgi:hypothetical protein